MPPKIRQRGKKPSKVRKLQQEQEQLQQHDAQSLASSASSSTNPIQSQADYIPVNVEDADTSTVPQNDAEEDQPNWIKLGDRPGKAEHEAPFGYVDAELKAYLRAGWERVTELESQGYTSKSTLTAIVAASAPSGAHKNGLGADDDEADDDDELALLLQATLKEMDGKELLLSTDPDTSLIVEAILHRLPAKPLRVFVDRLAGNFAVLAKHRFASHVIQACLTTLQPAVTLEHASQQHFYQHQHRSSGLNGKATASSAYASDAATIVNEDGILRSATQLILDLIDELSSDQDMLFSLVTDSFGSHVIRSLLCVLTGRNIQTDPSSTAHAAAASDLRSRRSAKFRNRKAPTAPNSAAVAGAVSPEDLLVVVPDLLYNRAMLLRQEILKDASVETVRRWATDAVASPLLQLLIEIEADSLDGEQGDKLWKGTLVDSLLNGFVSSPPETVEEGEVKKDVYLETSLRDNVASHALQLVLERAPASTASRFFHIYIRSRMAKLCIHPAANHIVATLIRRLSTADLEPVIAEMAKIASGMVKEQMVGCLQAAVDRVVQLTQEESDKEEVKELVKAVSEVVLAAFRFKSQSSSEQSDEEGLKLLVPAVLALRTRKAYLHTYSAHLKKDNRDGEGENGARGSKRGRDGKAKQSKTKYSKKKDAEVSNKEEEQEQSPWTMDASYELPAAESTTQGSLLLQSLLRLPGPAAPARAPPKRTFGRAAPASASCTSAARAESWGSALVLDSLCSLPTLTPFARNPTAVHTLISCLCPPPHPTSPHLDWNQSTRRRTLSSTLTTSLASFCGDKYGSRLADSLWFSVDGYSKEKIVKYVIEHSTEIIKQPYASYFTNKLQLQLYRKGKVREWNQAIQAQAQLANKDKEISVSTVQSGARKHSPIIVETKRVSEASAKSKRRKKSKLDGQLDSILDQI